MLKAFLELSAYEFLCYIYISKERFKADKAGEETHVT